MLKSFLKVLDIFLPAQFSKAVEVPLLYRGRVLVATNLMCLFGTAGLWMSLIEFYSASLIHISILSCMLTLIGNLFCIKNQQGNYERNLRIGANVQLFVIAGVVYLSAFSENMLIIFGLIYLIPTFLMISFYFRSRFSIYFALTNFNFFFILCYYKYDQYFKPLRYSDKVSGIFYVFLTFIIIFAYLLAFLFVRLSEELQNEMVKQKDLLVESAKFQSLGQMASNLAHDINNPLFTIQGKLHQMRNLLSRDQLDLDKCDQIVESVENTLFKLSQIVKGISTFAREGRGDQMVSIGVAELIENNLALSLDRIKYSGIELEIQVDSKATIICYASFISQVILNLMNNAIDALESATVK